VVRGKRVLHNSVLRVSFAWSLLWERNICVNANVGASDRLQLSSFVEFWSVYSADRMYCASWLLCHVLRQCVAHRGPGWCCHVTNQWPRLSMLYVYSGIWSVLPLPAVPGFGGSTF
jgi:hypothetical protein